MRAASGTPTGVGLLTVGSRPIFACSTWSSSFFFLHCHLEEADGRKGYYRPSESRPRFQLTLLSASGHGFQHDHDRYSTRAMFVVRPGAPYFSQHIHTALLPLAHTVISASSASVSSSTRFRLLASLLAKAQ